MSDSISYKGLEPHEVLYVLYHGTSAPQRTLAAFHDNPKFSLDEAATLIRSALEENFDGNIRFDYVCGRPIKIGLSTETKEIHRVWLYDRDAGDGKCAQLIAKALEQKAAGKPL